ncbi:MAG: deoxyribodipyrimidine photolyase [Bacteroidota bacterium]|nr:deoxyribodipyrimidine photolyase [Bacteroidota bacterium]
MKVQEDFPLHYTDMLEKLSMINPVAYAKTRNFIDGAVTGLSPYLSRGVISCRQVMEYIFSKGYTGQQAEKLVQELAWREYWQRCWWNLGDRISEDIKRAQEPVLHRAMVKGIANASTGIDAIDKCIGQLYRTGYMHNHARMYVASLACNVARAHWRTPARWMYYHLLDGDPASNFLSWQWVAGSFSSKKYFANQENINKYLYSMQRNSYLDCSYDQLNDLPVPGSLQESIPFTPRSVLPATPANFSLDPSLPLLLYHSFQLDPRWRKDQPANRVLILEPSHFEKYPVSEKVVQFIVGLANTNIPGIQIFTGEVHQIPGLKMVPGIYSVEHPSSTHYPGIRDPYPWMFPNIDGYFSSFSAFWKKAELTISKKVK